MSATWTINGTPLATLGLTLVGGTFNTASASTMRLRKVGDFTAADTFPWGTAVTLRRNGVPYFQGKVNSLPVAASDSDESMEIQIVDVWKELEETIYKEPWPAGSGSVMLPIAILGRTSNGAQCTDAQQIQEAVNYAASVGVAVQMGSIPAGLPLWQSEVRNVAVAEVIRLSLRFHPDWVPWLDHATVPPTLNFTPRSSMTARTIHIGDGNTTSVSITRRDDLRPDAVQILYLNATIIDGVTYRDWIEDKYPGGGPSAGPRVVSNVIELAGGQMQFQKQRIQTRKIPTNHDQARTWLKKSFPQIKDIPEDRYEVIFQGRKWYQEDNEDLPPLINPRAERLHVTEADDLPNELVAGSIEDWMRRKVGKVRVAFDVAISADASGEDRKLLEPLASMRGKTVTATNASTKIYKGITQWVKPEDAPVGIAAAIYNSLSAYQYEGGITTVMEDVSGTRFHGCKLNIGGGRSEWAGMNAVVHSVSFDIATGSTTISVGPAPFLSAENMLELQRLLRGRKVTWMSEDERKSNELGADSDPGSKGDTVGGFDVPTNEVEYKRRGRFLMSYDAESNRLYVSPGRVAAGPDSEDQVIRPMIPKIGGAELKEGSFLDVAGKTGTHELLCYFSADKAELKLSKEDEGEEPEEGEHAFLIGTITLGGDVKIDQQWESDIPWPMEASSSSAPSEESSDDGGGGPPGDGSSDDGSSKDTAIVPVSWGTGYAALYAEEATTVRFSDHFIDLRIRGRETRYRIDAKFLEVIERASLRAVSVCGDRPYSVGAVVEGEWLRLTALADKRRRPALVNVEIAAVRRGFLGVRMQPKTKEQFNANERRLKGG